MTTTALGSTVYTRSVAKVMISIPDDLLERLDAQARANRETRSGFLRRLVERELKVDEALRREELETLLSPSLPVGVDWVKLIREDRESH
jgi:HicB_like antitoxin of bacterial toxin-antitoxin system